MTWIDEFGPEYEIPEQILRLVREGRLFDMSWHNDVCPGFATVQADSDEATQEGARVLWVEHPDPEKRELSGAPRYGVTVMADGWQIKSELYEGDDLEAALAAVTDAAAAANVFDYFTARLGDMPFPTGRPASLKDYPLESVCGKASVKIIDAAQAFMAVCDPSVHNDIRVAATDAVEAVCFV